jgi:hypothetical protein
MQKQLVKLKGQSKDKVVKYIRTNKQLKIVAYAIVVKLNELLKDNIRLGNKAVKRR